jgi:hypothetical protein
MPTPGAIVLSVLTAVVLSWGIAAPSSASTVPISTVPISTVSTSAVSTSTATTVLPGSVASASFLEYSTDGTNWSSAAPSSLFPDNLRLSPGALKSVTIYVRSTRTDPTTMSAAISQLASSDTRFRTVVTIGAAGGAGPGWSKLASTLSTCQPIFTKVQVAANQVVPVTVTLALAHTVTGAQEQGSWIRFALLLGLSDVGAPTGPSTRG